MTAPQTSALGTKQAPQAVPSATPLHTAQVSLREAVGKTAKQGPPRRWVPVCSGTGRASVGGPRLQCTTPTRGASGTPGSAGCPVEGWQPLGASSRDQHGWIQAPGTCCRPPGGKGHFQEQGKETRSRLASREGSSDLMCREAQRQGELQAQDPPGSGCASLTFFLLVFRGFPRGHKKATWLRRDGRVHRTHKAASGSISLA